MFGFYFILFFILGSNVLFGMTPLRASSNWNLIDSTYKHLDPSLRTFSCHHYVVLFHSLVGSWFLPVATMIQFGLNIFKKVDIEMQC